MTTRNDVTTTIEDEAASWIAQLDSGLRTDADRIALREWMARSPRHAAELQRLAELWGDIDIAFQTHVESKPTRITFGSLLAAWFRLRPRQIYVAAGSTIAAAACAVLAVFFWGGAADDGGYRETYSVASGEQRLIALNDSSTLHLNTDSVVEVDYSRDLRVLRLLKGEAHFDVAHDPSRPFQVYAGQSRVTAIGTAFSVRLESNDVSVIVTEGRVELSDVPATTTRSSGQLSIRTSPETSVLSAGESAEINSVSREVRRTNDTGTLRRLAWREGLVAFQGDSLQHVVDEVSRYTPTSFVIADASIRDMRFHGTFKIGEVTALLGALESSFNIDVEFGQDNVIYLSRKAGDSAIPE